VAWEAIRGSVMDCVERFSFEQRVDASALQKLAMLHLPRFDASELAHRDLIPAEIERLALRAARLLDGYRPMTGIPHLRPLRKADVQVHELSGSLAHIIHERFHYLGSARQGIHYGLFHSAVPELPAAMVTLSPMDVDHLQAQADGRPSRIVSRMFAFEWAPFNSISSLLGAVSRKIPETLFTYVNPNLGFSASSYRAANWTFDGTKGVTYRYLDGDYITARQAYRLSQEQVTYSQYDLEPLQIWRHEP
jgi:hypothetical protein